MVPDPLDSGDLTSNNPMKIQHYGKSNYLSSMLKASPEVIELEGRFINKASPKVILRLHYPHHGCKTFS